MNSIKISIPSYKCVEPTDGTKPYYVYTIMVSVTENLNFGSSPRVHFVEKRYSDFLQLHNQLRKQYDTPEFPPKRVRNSRLKVLESRRHSLEHYMQTMTNLNQIPAEAAIFLRIPTESNVKRLSKSSTATDDTRDFGYGESYEYECPPNPAAAFFEDPFVESDSNSNLSDSVTRGVLDALYH